MRKEVYELWAEQWTKEHPEKKVPTLAQVNIMMELFELTEADIVGVKL